MSDEEEVLCHNNDLCKHLNDLGHVDFETYEPNSPYEFYNNTQSKDYGRPSSSPYNGLKNDAAELTPIDSDCHENIMCLLKSKLLFFEDVQFVESVLSCCYICKEKSMKYVIGAVATSFISIAAYFNRGTTGIDSYLPLSCVAMSSFYAAWKLYKDRIELKRNKLIALSVRSMQNLCIDFHKVLRFLKEVEILSTGQVSSQNVGSAMYIPINNVNGLKELPSWKTLPDLRKSVAESLIDVINLFSCGCDSLSKLSPPWIDIKGFISNNHVSPDPMTVTFEEIWTNDGCISLKDLQMLNDNYLLAQSEFLKWVSFYLCPAVWKHSKNKFVSFKNETLMNDLEKMQIKVCDMSLKLKLSFDLQKVFTHPESKALHQKTNLDDRILASVDLKELKELKVELHQIFLLVLSTVQKAKSLEDCLDTFYSETSKEKYVPINDLKDTLSHELGIVKNDLGQVIKDYDYIYCKIVGKNRSVSHENSSVETKNTACKSPNDKPESIGAGFLDLAVASDEVFLARSGSKPEDFEIDPDDWCIEEKVNIPQTLLVELSSTLKPIKKDFDEREQLVLSKLGIQDIKDKEAETPILNQNRPLSFVTGLKHRITQKNEYDKILSEGTSQYDTENSCIQNDPVSTANSLLMANLLKTSLLAQRRTNLEEESFSND